MNQQIDGGQFLMKIKLNAQPWYSGELYNTTFINGVSTEDVSPFLFERFDKVLGMEPEYIPDKNEELLIKLRADLKALQERKCIKCQENEKEMESLKKQLAKYKTKVE